jgi:hypothetical protein
MNRKQLLTLIAVGLVLGGLGVWAYKQKQKPYEESARRMGDKVVPDFPINDVAAVTIKTRDASVTLAKKDDLWTVQERGGHPAAFDKVSELLRKVWDLKTASPVRVGPSRLPQLELLPPDKSPSTLVEFKKADGKPAASLLLGAKHMREGRGDSQFGGGSYPDGRYVMVGTNIQSIALVSEPFSSVEPKPEDWLHKEWFKVEKTKSISVVSTNATNTWHVARESETNDWKLVDAKPGEQPDTSKLSSVTSALSYPSFNDVATNTAPEATGMAQPTTTAKLETFDGFTYDVKIGKKTGEDNYLMQVAVSGNIQKERTPGKDEKPEDKEKLDKEFKEKRDKLEEKLKTEKAFANWTYVVSKWTVDPLMKGRQDFLQEKKEEPQTTEKKEEPKTDTGFLKLPTAEATAKPESKPAEPKPEGK